MSDKKGWGSTVVGWFIVQDDKTGASHEASAADASTGADETAEEIIRKYAGGGESASAEAGAQAEAGANVAAPGEFFQSAPPVAPGGEVDFEGVFEAAGVDAQERERVTKAIDLLHSLPADTDKTVKKQIVEASLRAFGVPVEKIIEAGAEEIQALEFYIRAGANDTDKLMSESEERIRTYEEEIANIRKVMQQRVEEQQKVIRACNDKKLEVQQILEFFGRDRVAAVVKASPKLQDPTDAPQS